MRNEQPLLAVEELQVTYGGVPALQGVSLAVAPGEILGVVGESGCGKSTLLDAVLRLPRRDGRIAGGRIVFAGRDLAALGGRELRRLRGEQLGVVYQNPGETLNPSRRIRTQFYEALRAHRSVTRAEANTIAAAQMARLHLEEPEALLDSYPFQLSGGMAQRVALALAMVLEPQLLLADEPTSALDVTVQARVVEELLELRAARGTAILLVTHNLGVVARMADRVAVMYAGRLVESGTREQVLTVHAGPAGRCAGLFRPAAPGPAGQAAAAGHRPDGVRICGAMSPRGSHLPGAAAGAAAGGRRPADRLLEGGDGPWLNRC